jgi:hypothetical protein
MSGGFGPADQNGGEAAEVSVGLLGHRLSGQRAVVEATELAGLLGHRRGQDADTCGRKRLNSMARARAHGSQAETVR